MDRKPFSPTPRLCRSLRRSAERRLGMDAGYTLTELVIVIALSMVVIAVPSTFVVLSLNQQNASSSRSAAAAQEEIGLARLTRDLRQAAPNTSTTFTWGATSAAVSLTIPVPGSAGATNETIAWSCGFPAGGAGSCTRSVNGAAAVSEIANVTAVSFSPVDSSGNALGGSSSPHSASNPAYVGLAVSVRVVSQLDTSASHGVTGITNPVTLQDGVDLRNNSL